VQGSDDCREEGMDGMCVLHGYLNSQTSLLASVHMKGGMRRPPSLPSSPLVTVLLSLKNDKGLYVSKA